MIKIYYSERSQEESKNIELIHKFEHANKNILFNLSRLALGDIVNLNSLKKIDWKTLELKNHHQIMGHPGLTCSLTHSKNLSVAVCAKKEKLKSVGIDLEFKERDMKEGSDKFYINLEDEFSDESPLLRWCIKEACFKALSNSGEPIKLLKEVIIKENHFYFQNKANLNKNFFHIINEEGKYIVIAYCLKLNENKKSTTNEVEIIKNSHA